MTLQIPNVLSLIIVTTLLTISNLPADAQNDRAKADQLGACRVMTLQLYHGRGIHWFQESGDYLQSCMLAHGYKLYEGRGYDRELCNTAAPTYDASLIEPHCYGKI
jgi:hypothetical protein